MDFDEEDDDIILMLLVTSGVCGLKLCYNKDQQKVSITTLCCD